MVFVNLILINLTSNTLLSPIRYVKWLYKIWYFIRILTSISIHIPRFSLNARSTWIVILFYLINMWYITGLIPIFML